MEEDFTPEDMAKIAKEKGEIAAVHELLRNNSDLLTLFWLAIQDKRAKNWVMIPIRDEETREPLFEIIVHKAGKKIPTQEDIDRSYQSLGA